jgi:hypothetical protein
VLFGQPEKEKKSKRAGMPIVSIRRGGRKSPVKKRARTTPAKKTYAENDDHGCAQDKSVAMPTPMSAKDARDEVEGLIRREAGEMARALIEAVKSGQFGQVKYLFEVGGIHPAMDTVEAPREESVTARLLRKLDEQKEAAMDRSGRRAGDEIAKDEDAIE